MVNAKKLIQTLADFDKRQQEIDELVKNLRLRTHNLFWELFKIKKDERIKPPA